jgi:hypothetical protein
MEVIFTGEEKGGKSFTVAPAGRYLVNVFDAEETVSAKGNSCIKIVWEISGGEHQGTRIWNYLVLNDGGKYNARKCVEALGVPWVKGEPLTIGRNLVGRECEADVTIEIYQEKEKNAIKQGGYHKTEAMEIMGGGLPF